MPSKKQRRRRQKEFRHEYEYVVVDDEGREVELPREERMPERKDSDQRSPARGGGAKRAQPSRKVDPPSWSRTFKRGLFFFPIFFLALSVLNSAQPVAGRVAVALVYTALFIPFMYLMDRVKYRAYLRRTGPTAGEPARRR